MFGFQAKKQIQVLRHNLQEAAEKINDLETKYNSIKAILENMVEGVITVDKNTRIVSLNPSTERIFSISKKESEGRFFLEAVRNNDISEIISRVLRNGKCLSQELVLVWPFNKTFQINASPIFDGNIVNGCLLVIHDITEVRNLETIRRDFIANASHELKTPLTSIKGFVETLLEGALQDKQNCRQFLEIIQEHTKRLDRLVDDLLELSHLESKEIILKKEEVGLKDLTDNILTGFKAQLVKKDIAATNDLAFNLFLKADKDKIGQVLSNLVENAIKFNREGGSIKIYSQDLGDKIKVFLDDSGIGIPPKDIPRIFERFYRVDKARSRELGGTGLGLSIVKHIVELHAGSVGLESTDGFGSKFWFILPK